MTLDSTTLINEIEALVASLPGEECRSCECFLGLLAQLEIDGREKVRHLVAQYGSKNESIHSCLGCDPCPPADALADYLQSRNETPPVPRKLGVSGELESPMNVRARLFEQARAFGASLAGIASVAALKDSPSHAAGRTVDWPAQAKSVLVLALAHQASEPELDWWDSTAGGSPGNRRLIRIANDISTWLADEFSVSAHPLPYRVGDGGIYLKDAAALAGLGIIGRNNLLVTPEYGPRVRLRALFLDLDLAPSGPIDFAPCEGCEMPCRQACPKKAFISGGYSRALCKVQMMADEARRGSASPVAVVKYCRACELACPVPR